MTKSLSVLLCDDDPPFRQSLRESLVSCFHALEAVIEVYECGGARELQEMMSRQSFDLIFLDIDMPHTDGIRLGQQLRDSGCRSDIIYVSNLDERVYEIFSVHPWSFIRKSRCEQELPSVIGEYVQHLRRRTGLMLCSSEGRLLSLEPEEIVYIEAAGKLQKLIFPPGKKTAEIRSSMNALERMTGPFGFIRIHKGFLVNYHFIRRITSRTVILDSGLSLPIGRDRLKSARERYLSLMKWKGLGPPQDA